MNLYKQYLDKLNEKIVLDVNIGDTILTGRFKNKKTVVKSIGKDDHGMPTINGRPAVKFRYAKTDEETSSGDIAGYSSKNAFRKKKDEDDLELYLVDESETVKKLELNLTEKGVNFLKRSNSYSKYLHDSYKNNLRVGKNIVSVNMTQLGCLKRMFGDYNYKSEFGEIKLIK